MEFLSSGIPLGRYFGINVRLHFTFLIYAFYRINSYHNLGYGVAFVVGLYLCILLHEFGHALAARWCDGEAEDILLWPLGGLAMCRPAWHPTAHLITAAAGPFVTLVLAVLFWGGATALKGSAASGPDLLGYVWFFLSEMALLNFWLLLFNLIPAFPMDGGRILRDTIWHFTRAETATRIAVWVSRVIATLGIIFAVYSQAYMLILIAVFILLQASAEYRILAFEAAGTYSFSIRERLRRGTRQRAFRSAVGARQEQAAAVGFHRCAVCGKTELDDPYLDFRVCTDCRDESEYCPAHLDTHTHR